MVGTRRAHFCKGSKRVLNRLLMSNDTDYTALQTDYCTALRQVSNLNVKKRNIITFFLLFPLRQIIFFLIHRAKTLRCILERLLYYQGA
jgi:hypothetical protein